MSPFRLFLIQPILSSLPSTRGWYIKRLLYRWAGVQVGKDVRIVSTVQLRCTGTVEIGDDTFIGHDVRMVGGDATIRIGSHVDIGPRVTLVTGTHRIDSLPVRAAGTGYSNPITVEDGAWIGASATILGGVTISRCSVVGAGALVNKDVPPYCVVGGVPARIVRKLKVGAGEMS